MISKEIIEKLILGTGEDRELANEYIREYKIDIIPKGFTPLLWDSTHYSDGINNLYKRKEDNTWYLLVSQTTGTTTKI